MLPRIVRSPVEICFGTSPSQAPKSRPLANTSPVPIAATIALVLILAGERFNLAGEALDARIQMAPVSGQLLDDARHAGRENIGLRRQDARQLDPQETQSLPHRNAPLQQEG